MSARTIALALLMLAVVVMAQQADERVIDVGKVREAGENILKDAKTVALALNYVAIAVMIGASLYVLLLESAVFQSCLANGGFGCPLRLIWCRSYCTYSAASRRWLRRYMTG